MNKIKQRTGKFLFVAFLGALTLMGCKPDSDTPDVEKIPPTVETTVPIASATGVAVNANVTAEFSEDMNSATITAASFTLVEITLAGTEAVTGDITYDTANRIASFNPDANLKFSTVYTATVSIAVKDLAGNAMLLDKAWNFTTGTAPDLTGPVVTARTPDIDVTGVAVTSNISATFDEPLASATVNATSFTVTTTVGSNAILGVVTYAASVATFNPDVSLAYSTGYTATITTVVTDIAGNAMLTNQIWNFTTAAAPIIPDTTAPTVVSTVPVSETTGVARSADISVTFSETMNAATIIAANFTVYNGSTAVPGVVSYDAATKTASFNPGADLEYLTYYKVTVTTGMTDAAANALSANNVWYFETVPAPESVPPTVSSVTPLDSATGVSISTRISAIFSEPMNSATIVAANFTVLDGATPVLGTVTYDIGNRTAVFSPAANLALNKVYSVKITTAVTDLVGNAMLADETWSFTTTNSTPLGPAPVRLGTAGNFVILAKTAVSTVPDSIITGNVGVSPAAETFLTGFSQTKATGYSTCPQVTGFLYAADMTPPTPSNMTTAISDMETAYTDAATRTDAAIINLGAGTLSGNTLAPGLYNWDTSVNITDDITLSGAANDVWILQTSKDLTLASGKKILLAGGAQAKNIFWQVAEIVSLETTAEMQGIILSQTQVIMKTGSKLTGRALAQTQVTLDKATVTQPAE